MEVVYCKKGHIKIDSGFCKECRAWYFKEYYKANQDKIKERSKQYSKSNRENFRKYSKAYYNRNKEACHKRVMAQQKKERDNLADSYILNQMERDLKAHREIIKQIPGAIEAKRLVFLLKRGIRKIKEKVKDNESKTNQDHEQESSK